jgi:hypothetical protein
VFVEIIFDIRIEDEPAVLGEDGDAADLDMVVIIASQNELVRLPVCVPRLPICGRPEVFDLVCIGETDL